MICGCEEHLELDCGCAFFILVIMNVRVVIVMYRMVFYCSCPHRVGPSCGSFGERPKRGDGGGGVSGEANEEEVCC